MYVRTGTKQNAGDLSAELDDLARVCVYLGHGLAGVVANQGRETALLDKLDALRVRRLESLEPDNWYSV
jgi:hypothetical protein